VEARECALPSSVGVRWQGGGGREVADNVTSREEELLAASDRAESLYYQLHGGYARKRGFARFRQAVRL
jgi:hypothetical protein